MGEKQEEQEIASRIPLERGEDGDIYKVGGKSHKPQDISRDTMLYIAKLGESLQKFSSSSDNNSKKISRLTIVLIILGIIQIAVILLSAFDILG